MGNEDHRLARRFFRKVVHQFRLGLGIERGTEFVQEQDAARTQEAAGDGDPLRLTLAEAGPTLAAAGIQPFGQGEHEASHGGFQGRIHFLLRRFRVAHQQILADGSAEQRIALRHIHEIAAGGCGSRYFLLLVIQDHPSGDGLQQGEHQTDERALPRSGLSHDSGAGEGRKIKSQVLENHTLPIRIAVVQTFHANTGGTSEFHGVSGHFLGRVLQFHQAVDGCGGIHEGRDLAREVHERTLDLSHELQESGHHAEGQGTLRYAVHAP